MARPESPGIRAPTMAFLLLGLGIAGFGVLIAYVTFCDRI